jgi:hypothetical protein
MQRRTLLKALAAGGVLPLAAGAAAPAASGPWRDVLDTPAQRSPLAPNAILTGLARAGKRVVAVGQRGHVLLSDDAGKSWQQADVPSAPTWSRCRSRPPSRAGRSATTASSCTAPMPAAAGRASSTAAPWATSSSLTTPRAATTSGSPKRSASRRKGAENPFLDVWFDDAKNGIVVGAFGLVLRTGDGGQTWEPLLHATDNPKSLHLYAVRRIGGELFIAGEQGLLLKLDRDGGRFAALTLPMPERCSGWSARTASSSPTACAATSCAAPTAARPGKAFRPASASA